MSRSAAATIPEQGYDNCLISSCLKKLFTKSTKSRQEPEILITERVADVRSDLQQLAANSATELSFEYLSAMEASLCDASFRYAVISRGGTPVLFCYFQVISFTDKNFDFGKNKSFVKRIFTLFLGLKKIKVLFAGNAVRIDTHAYSYDTDVLGKDEAMEIVTSAAERIAADECLTAVIIKDVPFSATLHKWLNRMAYSKPWNDQTMVLTIDRDWKNMDDYVNALSRKYRTRANKALAAKSTLSAKLLSAGDIVRHSKTMHRLFAGVADSQPFVLANVSDSHFRLMKEVYGDSFEVVAFFEGEKMVAFYSAFVTATAYELYYVGFSYDDNAKYQLYFNLLFSGLERAIALGSSQLKLGRTSFDAKASLGAMPVETDYAIKAAHVPGLAMKWFAEYFSAMEDNKWKLRSPFKERALA